MSLTAGAARRDISPRKPLQLYGYPHHKRVSTGTHDPLYASALLLDNGEQKLIHIVLDILMLNPPDHREIRGRVATRLGIEEAAVFMSCTHTHSGPITTMLAGWKGNAGMGQRDPDYMAFLKAQVEEAAAAAAAAPVPAAYAWTTANATGVGGNRLQKGGLTDPEVGMLAIRNTETGKLMALTSFYGMHPTVMHEDSFEVSSDFIGYTRQHLEETYGDDFITVYHNAPCGNQSPRNFVKGQTFAEAERLGRKLGAAMLKSLEKLGEEDFRDDPQLACELREVELPRRELLSVEEAEKQLAEYRATYERLQAEDAGHGPIRTAECSIFGAEGALALAKAKDTGALDEFLSVYPPFQLQKHVINGVTVFGWPGECFTEYALELKERADSKVFISAFVNGEMQGYIVTPEAAKAGGYEANNAIYAPESGTIFVETSLDMLNA